MPPRGTYRGVYANLVDDPDFQQLSSDARHVLLTVRLSPDIGPAGIFRYYIEPIAHRTGLTVKRVESALEELERPKDGEELGWIVREGVILWVVNALRHDPTMHLSDDKHLKSVHKAIACLPHQKLVLTFCDYYKIPRAFEGPSKGLTKKDSNVPPSPISDSEIRDPIPIPNTPPAPPAECSLLLNFWSDTYLERFGQRPEVEGKRDMQCSKAILSGRSLEDAKGIVLFHFDHPSPFYAEKNLYGIHHIRKDCNQIVARMANGGNNGNRPEHTDRLGREATEDVATFLRREAERIRKDA